MLLGDLDRVHVDAVLEPPLLLADLDIVARHLSLTHTAILGEGPVLKAVAPLPLHLIVGVLILVPELHRDLVFVEREELLAQLVVVLFVPFPGEERYDLVSACDEPLTVSPD